MIGDDIYEDEFFFNLSEFENFLPSSNSKLRFWFNHIRQNALKEESWKEDWLWFLKNLHNNFN